ncbi:MAG: RHS repeat-associated core domain-containing protein [Anaerolineae bacterium]|nr:RHS repeat-associated core domain-containing protein [Anaerolineae bacterium]
MQDYETTWGILKQSIPTYGDLFEGSGTTQTGFGFTGEVTDTSGLVYLRARYYVPELGVFPSLDPVEEGNRYGYVGGDLMNFVDLSEMVGERPKRWDDNSGAPFRPESAGVIRDGSGRISTCALRSSMSTGFRSSMTAIQEQKLRHFVLSPTTVAFALNNGSHPAIRESERLCQHHGVLSCHIATVDFGIALVLFPGLPVCGALTIQEGDEVTH